MDRSPHMRASEAAAGNHLLCKATSMLGQSIEPGSMCVHASGRSEVLLLYELHHQLAFGM